MLKHIILTIGGLFLALRLFSKKEAKDAAFKLITFFESSNKPSLKARYDQLGKRWEIGYGCTFYENGKKVQPTDVITLERAKTLMYWHINQAREKILLSVKVPINENQLQALISFVYNVGIGAFRTSRMLTYINRKQFDLAANEFDRWDNAGGVKNVAGLVKRRQTEKKLFQS